MSIPELSPVQLRLQRQPGPLREQIEAALSGYGQPLRWAITAVPQPGQLQIEAVVLSTDDSGL